MRIFWFGASLLLLAACQSSRPDTTDTPAVGAITYPTTKKVDVTDDYHGTSVADPYRWLEYDTAADVAEWVKAQNEITQNHLRQIPYREALRARLTQLYDYERYASPFRVGEFVFFSKNDGLQNQSVIYRQQGLDGAPAVFLDPNQLSEDGTVTANLAGRSKDDRYVSYAVNRSGSDWTEFYVMDVASGQQLADSIGWAKFSGTAWRGDGFYYSSYGQPTDGKAYSGKNEYHKVYYHRLGTPQSQDELIFEDADHPLRNHRLSVTEDERFLILYASQGTYGTEVRYRDLQRNDNTFRTILPGFDYEYSVVDNDGDHLLVYTNHGAPNYRVVRVNPRNPDPARWTEVIAEKPDKLASVSRAGDKLFASYLQDVATRVYQHDRQGNLEREVELPALGSAGGFQGSRDAEEVFYSFTSFTYPPSLYRYDLRTGASTPFKQSQLDVDLTAYETKQVFYESKDGTSVPMFIIHKKDLPLDGKRPTLLYAYGGFNISLTPSFSAANLALLEQGGVYAQANIRGGGEYGEAWHRAGMKLNKQNVFDDFIAAAEYLIAENYTAPAHLAVSGRSNGGLLVGAVMTQRPDLFAVAFPGVGVLDMLRYHKFTIGWAWATEYGSADSSAYFEYLKGYSPLHNVRAGTQYPATMITTADHDDRVVPAHSFKFAATLQEHHTGENPVLIRIDTKAGHGAGKPISKVIEEQADLWAFLFHHTDAEYSATAK